MRTDELIGLLAADAAPVPRHAGEKRLALALGAGLLLSLVWMVGMYGLRPDLAEVAPSAAFWLKLAMPLAVGAAALVAVFRLGHPGWRLNAWAHGLWLPVLLLWAWGLMTLAQAEPGARVDLVLGNTWRSCAVNVASTAVPVWLAVFWALRGLAPTRPAYTGAVAGWLAGAAGAAVYALHCPEMEAPFLAVWYVLGMALPAAVGALAGRWLLRW